MPTVWKQLPLQKKLRALAGFHRSLHGFHVRRKREMVINQYLNTLADAKKALADPAIDLVFVHWSIPHPNGIYNRVTRQLAWDGARQSYLDNLELVDNTIGELRRFMESAGTWHTSAVIVSSDHPYRTFKWKSLTKEEREAIGGKFDGRIPFLIKLAGQERPVIYDSAFNTVLTHDLVLALLQNTIKDPNGLVDWLKEHGVDRRPAARAATDSPVDDE
jgi:arylsulfatase A-like enzyme